MEFQKITASDRLWNQVKTYAESCSWRAGKSLAGNMARNSFEDWERVIIATENGKICGYCTVAKRDCIPDVDYTPYIGYLFVGEEYRGNRLSQKLIQYACNYLTHLGFEKVHIVSDHENFYEKYGFHVIDRQKAPWGSEEKIYVKKLKRNALKLIEPTMEYEKEIQAFRQEFLSYGGSMDGCGSLRRFDNIQDWIDQVEQLKSAETTPPHLVPMTQYIYVREEDNKVVGVIQIRHYFNDYLRKYAGHIGYSVCPGERRKGYATQMLKEVLPVCKSLGIPDVLICCLTENEGSRKTILNNGGVYECTVHEPERDIYLERYWIHLQ